MSNNMYDILGKMASLLDKEEIKESAETTPVYESIEPSGDIMKAVRGLEAKFNIFKEAKEEDIKDDDDKEPPEGFTKEDEVKDTSLRADPTKKAYIKKVSEGHELRGLHQIDDNEVYAVTPARGSASLHVHGIINSPADHKKFKEWYGSDMSTRTGAQLKRMAGKLSHSTNVFDKFNEGAIDDIRDARLEKEANTEFDDDEFDYTKAKPKSNVRKVSGASYGGSKAKADKEELDEYSDTATAAHIPSPTNNNPVTSDLDESSDEFSYQLLGRLQADCEYFLNAGNRSERHLWAGNVADQIAKMKELYNALPTKPEWITKQDILGYENQMSDTVEEGAIDDIRDARLEKEANTDFDDDDFKPASKSATRRVSGASYGGSKAKADKEEELDEASRTGISKKAALGMFWEAGYTNSELMSQANEILSKLPQAGDGYYYADDVEKAISGKDELAEVSKSTVESVDSADAYRILNDLDANKDFFTLNLNQVHALLACAKEHGYRKGKYASGSTARMFHQQLRRRADKHQPIVDDAMAALDAATNTTGEIQEMTNKQKGISFLEAYKKHVAESTAFGDKIENSKAQLKNAKADGKTAGHKPMKQELVKEAAELRDQPLYTEPDAWAQYAKEKAEQEMGGIDDMSGGIGGLDAFDAEPDMSQDNELNDIAKLAGLPSMQAEPESIPSSDLAGSMAGGIDTMSGDDGIDMISEPDDFGIDDNSIDIVADEPEMELDEGGQDYSINGKPIDVSSIELGGVHHWDAPDYADAYVEVAYFEDGTELSDDELDQLQDEHSGLVNDLANQSFSDRSLSVDESEDDGDLGTGNSFSSALATAKASGAKEFDVDGRTYTVKEDQTALNLMRKLSGLEEIAEERNIEYVNTPREKVAPVSAAIPSGNDMHKSKKQDAKTANKAANPLTKDDKKVDESLWNKYTGILKGIKK